jgi:hypothetical protein
MTTNLSDWALTMNVVASDRASELLGGPPATRAVLISAVCWRCCVRRGPVTVTTRTDYHHPNHTFQTSRGENPCGHIDTDAHIVLETMLQCEAGGCVVMTSDTFYPYCSPQCSTPKVTNR